MKNVEVNPNREYMLAGDISMSMNESDSACNGLTRYEYMLEKFKLFIHEAGKFDDHGTVDVLLFGENVYTFPSVTIDDIGAKLNSVQFEGMTNTDKAIKVAYKIHAEERNELKREGKVHPGTVLFIFTDGAATNKVAVEDTIVAIANDIKSEDEFNITFLTVGNTSTSLEQWLKGLHDKLESRVKQDFDIFHREKLEDVDFLGAVNTVNHD